VNRVYDYELIRALRAAGIPRPKVAQIAGCSVETVARMRRLGLIPKKRGRKRVWREKPCIGCGIRLRYGANLGPRCEACDRRHLRNGSCACGRPWSAKFHGRVRVPGSKPKTLLPCARCGASPTPAMHGGPA